MKKFFLIILFLFFLNFVSSVPCTGSQVSDCLSTSPPCINYYENRGGLYYQCGSGSPFCTQSEITCTPDAFDPYEVNLPPWFTNVETNYTNASAGTTVNFSAIVNDDGLVDVAWFRDNFNSSFYNISYNLIYNKVSYDLTARYNYSERLKINNNSYLTQYCLYFKEASERMNNLNIIIYGTYWLSGTLFLNKSNILASSNIILDADLPTTASFRCFSFNSPPLLQSGVNYLANFNYTASSSTKTSMYVYYIDGNQEPFIFTYTNNQTYNYQVFSRTDRVVVSSKIFVPENDFSSGLQNRTSWDLNDAVKGLNVSITMPSIAGNYKYQWCGADTIGLGTTPPNCYNFSYFVNQSMTDITNPTISIVSPANNSKANRDIWIDGIASDNLGLRQIWAEYTIGIGNTTWTNISECQSMDTQLADCHWKLNNNTIYSSGTYVYRLRTFDLAGNTATSIARVLSLDTTLPFVLWFNISYNPFGSKMSIRPGEFVNITLNISDRETGLAKNSTMNTTGNPYFLNGTNKNMSMLYFVGGNISAGGTSLWNLRFLVGTSPDGSNLTEYFSYDNSTNYLDYFLRILVDNAQPVSTGTSIANSGVIWNNSYVIFTSDFTHHIRLDNWTVQINTSGVWANESTQPFYQQYEETIYWAKLMNQGNYSFRIFAYSDAGNLNISDNIEFEVRGAEPNLIITNIFPENDAILTTLSNNFTFNYTGGTATNCSLILVNDTASQYNQTISSPAENTSLNFSQINMNSFNDSSFSWETECCLQRGETYCFRDISILTINTSYSVPQNISLEWLYPTINQTIPRNRFTNISINVTCNNENCGNINSSLAIIVSAGGGTTSTSITSIFEDGNVSNTATCSAYTRDKTGSVLTTGKSGGAPGAPVRAYYYFNLSSIPAGATMTNITLNISVDSVSSATSCQIYNLDTDNNTNTATTLWTDAGDGTNYVFNSDFCQTAGFKTINLGTNATGNATNFNITKGWFGIGIPTNTSWGCSPASQPWSKFDASENSSYAPTLIITYTTTSTDQISLINSTTTSVPFYTNSTNPENTTSLNAGQSAVITYWVNSTGANSTYYQFYAFANRTANMSVNTMINALNLTIEDVLADTTLPYFTFIPNNQTLELNVTGLLVNFTGTDAVGFGTYNISDKINFSINSTGGVINLTKLARMDYILNITINDTSNNINWTLFNVSVQDTRKPYFTLIPANATLEYKTTGLNVDFNASDDGVGFATYKIDDIVNFTINSTGGLINATSLSLRTYTLNVSINDTISLVNYTLYKVFVNDTTSPVYTSISNISIYTNQSVLGDYSATDLDTITWNLNDTTKFSINTTGDLINSTNLTAGVYYLIVYINDSSNNRVSKDINVTVSTAPDTTPPYFQNISNLLHYTNESVKMDFNATDETSFSSWATNNTANFSINSTGYFQNISTLTPGIIYINISINDTIGNLNSTIINVTTLRQVHNFPNIEIVFPTNNTNSTNTNLDVNYTRTDDFGIDSCWYSNNSGLINTTLVGCDNITSATWLEGLNNLTFWINDTDNNVNSTKVSFRVDTIQPYLTENLNTQTREYKYQNLSYDINSSDSGVGVQCFAVNNTIRFSINCAGLLINATSLEIGNYFVNITFNDTLNNTNSTVLQVTIQDTTKPTITQPANATIELNVTGLGVDFDASDISNLGSWLINDTINFQINSSGWLKNLTMLINKTYFINVSINDTIGNINETLYQVIVSDTLKPYFSPLPVNQSVYTNQSLSYDINAFDVGVNFIAYKVNDTRFSVNTTGGIINTSTLNSGNYTFNLSINDTQGNVNYTILSVNVWLSPDITPPTFTSIPANATLELNVTGLSVDFTGTDETGFGSYKVDDIVNFTINTTGGLINATKLTNRTYILNITINDTSNNINWALYQIDVTDTIKPYWLSVPVNVSIYNNQSVQQDYNTFDDGVNYLTYSVNNTINFQINTTGGLINISSLSLGIYWVNISVNDSNGLLISEVVFVNVTNSTIFPFFTHLLTNQSFEYHIGLNYDINATDTGIFDNFAVNDSRFTINSTGALKNSSQLEVRSYYINISINDTSNNLNSTMLNVSVTQTNSIIYLSIAGTRANYSTNNNTNINFSAELILGLTENITILINDSISANKSLITSNTTKITEVGNDYNVTAIYYGNTNFSKATETWWLDVSEYVISGTGGSGGGGGLLISNKVCNITYPYLLNGSFNETFLLKYINQNIEEITLGELRVYKNNWQSFCSDRINRTLAPKYVCESIYRFILSNNYNYTEKDLTNLAKNISKQISVSNSLLKYYIKNYDNECLKKGYFKKLPNKLSPEVKFLKDEYFGCTTDLPGFLDAYLPMASIILGNSTCGKIKVNRIFFKLELNEDQLSIIGIRVWLVFLFLLIVGIIIFIYFRKRNNQEIKKLKRKISLLS